MIQIKKTKSVDMEGDKDGIGILIGNTNLWVPARLVFQVKRGLET
jgi:hypothetical protein